MHLRCVLRYLMQGEFRMEWDELYSMLIYFVVLLWRFYQFKLYKSQKSEPRLRSWDKHRFGNGNKPWIKVGRTCVFIFDNDNN